MLGYSNNKQTTSVAQLNLLYSLFPFFWDQQGKPGDWEKICANTKLTSSFKEVYCDI